MTRDMTLQATYTVADRPSSEDTPLPAPSPLPAPPPPCLALPQGQPANCVDMTHIAQRSDQLPGRSVTHVPLPQTQEPASLAASIGCCYTHIHVHPGHAVPRQHCYAVPPCIHSTGRSHETPPARQCACQLSDQGPQPHDMSCLSSTPCTAHGAACSGSTSGSAMSVPASACPVTHPLVREPYAPHPSPSLGLGACRKCNATIQSPSAPERERDLLSKDTGTTTVKLPMEHATLPELLQQGMAISTSYYLAAGQRQDVPAHTLWRMLCGPLCTPVEGLGYLPQARGSIATQHTHPPGRGGPHTLSTARQLWHTANNTPGSYLRTAGHDQVCLKEIAITFLLLSLQQKIPCLYYWSGHKALHYVGWSLVPRPQLAQADEPNTTQDSAYPAVVRSMSSIAAAPRHFPWSATPLCLHNPPATYQAAKPLRPTWP